jgi:predicted nuclease of predicted toxin-antitoxin system
VIVTKDDDFLRLKTLRGYLPKVVLPKLGDCTNQHVPNALLNSPRDILAAWMQEEVGLLKVY